MREKEVAQHPSPCKGPAPILQTLSHPNQEVLSIKIPLLRSTVAHQIRQSNATTLNKEHGINSNSVLNFQVKEKIEIMH
jgi:hypothetical protein